MLDRISQFFASLGVGQRSKSADVTASNEAYRLGRLDRATRKFNPPGRSGDAAIYESNDLMNRRTRSSYLNNAMIRRATHVLRDIVVGTGINAFADPIDYSFGWSLDERPETELEGSFNYALENDELFQEWSDNEASVSGNCSWPEMQAMAITEDILVGDVLFLECLDRSPGRVSPLCYQMIEREQIDLTKDRDFAPGQNAIVNGFEIDRAGREVAVYLYDAHPFSQFGQYSADSTRVPSSRYNHVFKPHRPTMTSGATWLHAVGQPTIDRDTWTGTELRAAVKAALLTIVHKMENPGRFSLGFTSDDPDPSGRSEVTLGDSLVAAEIGTNESIEIKEGARPNSKAAEFFNMIDHDIAGGVDLSYYSLTGRFNETNYGGFRGAINLEDTQTRPIQNWLGRKLILPVRRRFTELAIATGEIRTITTADFRRDRRRYLRFDVIGPGRNLLEPSAENEAILGQLRGGLSTLKIECARRGLHWIKVLRQIALENRIADWLGIVLDYSKGQGGQVSTNTRSKTEQDGSDQQTQTKRSEQP